MRWIAVLCLVVPATAQVRFEENAGQAPGSVLYAGRGPGFDAVLTGDGVRWAEGGRVHRLRFIGAGAPAVRGGGPLDGRVNYLGRGRSHTGIRTYEHVRYEGVYPGIDAVIRGNAANQLEYDFVVAPGADPGRIALDLDGPKAEPFAYQDSGGKRLRVDAKYRILPGGRTGFRLGAYDRSKTLVIDPVVTTGTYFGGVGGGFAECVKVDKQGFVYIAGTIYSNHLLLEQPLQEYFAGSNDLFVTKFDPSGTRLIFSTYFGSIGDERALDMALDAQGAVYITGFTSNPEFPVTPGAFQTRYAGGSVLNGGDAFLVKIAPAGDRVVYATYYGGSKDEYSRGVAVDSTGAAYITGGTLSLDLPLRNPVQDHLEPVPDGQPTTYIARDFFVAKFTPDGSDLMYSTYVGGTAIDEGYGVRVDSKQQAWVFGRTQVLPGSTPARHDFPLVNAIQTNFGGSTNDIVLMKFSPDGRELLYSTIQGGSGDDLPRAGSGIEIDGDDFVYITGDSGNTAFPRPAGARLGIAGNREVFIAKYSPDGKVVAANIFGGQMNENSFGIAVDGGKNVWIAGLTQSRNFYLKNELQSKMGSACTSDTVNCATADWFVAKFNPDLTEVLFSTYLGGSAADQARSIALDPNGGAWVTGLTQSAGLPVVQPVQDRFNGGGAVNVTYLVRIAPE